MLDQDHAGRSAGGLGPAFFEHMGSGFGMSATADGPTAGSFGMQPVHGELRDSARAALE